MPHPREILASLSANALKTFSQNFLTSPHWAEKITDAALQIKDADALWEIGPGLGALTGPLLIKTVKPLTAFEIDRKLASYLRQTYPHLTLVEGDFLKVNIRELAQNASSLVVVSNLPYHLSSPILFKLLEEKHRLKRLVLTFQKEFAQRLSARPRTPDYGALSVIAQLHFSITSLGVLPPGAFYPVPGVGSEALIMEPKSGPSEAILADASRVVKIAFRQRRKKLFGNLKQVFPDLDVETIARRLALSPTVRPEELGPEDFLRLTQELMAQISNTICEI